MYNYNFNDYSGISSTSLLAGLGIYIGILLVLSILMIISNWKIYKKAGEHGWASIIPVYNIVVLLEICDLPLWYIILFMIPIVNIYVIFKIYIELAHKFGKSTGFGVLTVFFSVICLPILAFGKSVYQKNNDNENDTNTNIENNSINQNTFNDQVDRSNVDFNSIYQEINNDNSINSFVPVGDLNINNQNDLLNSTIKCPNCGKEVSANLSFCDNCGQILLK